MIILPIGHEYTTFRRFPHLTIGLVLACCLVFGATYFTINDDQKAEIAGIKKLIAYYIEHDYLSLDPEFVKRQIRTFQALYEENAAWAEKFRSGDPIVKELLSADLATEQREKQAESEEAVERGIKALSSPSSKTIAEVTASFIGSRVRQREFFRKLEQRTPQIIRSEQAALDLIQEQYRKAKEESLLRKFGFIPARKKIIPFFTHLLLHGGIAHLLFNMVFLWLAAAKLEDIWGIPVLSIVYLLCGAAGAGAHAFFFPQSDLPLIGASGAISGLMGSFLVRLASSKIKFFYAYFLLITWRAGTFLAPAFIMIPLWAALQFFYAYYLSAEHGVAYWAHVGGFGAGVVLALLIKVLGIERKIEEVKEERTLVYKQHPKTKEGLFFIESGEFDKAAKALRAALAANPRDFEAREALVKSYEGLGNAQVLTSEYLNLLKLLAEMDAEESFGEAIVHFQQKCGVEKLSERDSFTFGQILRKAGSFSEASAIFYKVFSQFPPSQLTMKAVCAYGEICIEKLNDKESAWKAYMAAIKHVKQFPEFRDAIEKGLRQSK